MSYAGQDDVARRFDDARISRENGFPARTTYRMDHGSHVGCARIDDGYHQSLPFDEGMASDGTSRIASRNDLPSPLNMLSTM